MGQWNPLQKKLPFFLGNGHLLFFWGLKAPVSFPMVPKPPRWWAAHGTWSTHRRCWGASPRQLELHSQAVRASVLQAGATEAGYVLLGEFGELVVSIVIWVHFEVNSIFGERYLTQHRRCSKFLVFFGVFGCLFHPPYMCRCRVLKHHQSSGSYGHGPKCGKIHRVKRRFFRISPPWNW